MGLSMMFQVSITYGKANEFAQEGMQSEIVSITYGKANGEKCRGDKSNR